MNVWSVYRTAAANSQHYDLQTTRIVIIEERWKRKQTKCRQNIPLYRQSKFNWTNQLIIATASEQQTEMKLDLLCVAVSRLGISNEMKFNRTIFAAAIMCSIICEITKSSKRTANRFELCVLIACQWSNSTQCAALSVPQIEWKIFEQRTKNERRHTCTYIVHSNILFKQFRWELLQWKREFSAEKEINKWNTSRCCRWCWWRWMVRYDEICSECVSSASRY